MSCARWRATAGACASPAAGRTSPSICSRRAASARSWRCRPICAIPNRSRRRCAARRPWSISSAFCPRAARRNSPRFRRRAPAPSPRPRRPPASTMSCISPPSAPIRTPPRPMPAARREGEAAVLAAVPAAVILRPSVIFGVEDDFFNRFATMARYFPVIPMVGAQTKFQPVYVGDVAEAVAAAHRRPAPRPARSMNSAARRRRASRELVDYVLQVTERDRRVAKLPSRPASSSPRSRSSSPNCRSACSRRCCA